MALLVLDESAVGVSKAPNNGFVIQLTGIKGLDGINILIPFETEQASQIYEAIGEALGMTGPSTRPHVVPATPQDVQREARRYGAVDFTK
jgi:hypothetical protein